MTRKLLGWWPVAAVALPIAVAATRAATGGWIPISDDAYFTVRSRDVLTAHHPLVGAWSSGSATTDDWINNLGPLQLDLLAPFTRWTPVAGTAIGVAVVQIAAVVAIGWMVRRMGGRHLLAPAMIPVGLLAWTMGSEMLITPRQHQYAILPYLCLLVAAWAVTSGDRWAIVVAVVAGSLVVQTHLTYPVLAAALVPVMALGQALRTRAGDARGGRRPLVVSGVLAVVLWIQPLVDQVSGFHNLGKVFGTGSSSGSAAAGPGRGLRIVAGGLLSPDMLLRPGYRRYDAAVPDAAPWQVAALVVLLAAGVAVLWLTRHRIDGTTAAGAGVAITAVLAGVLDASLLPSTTFGFTVSNYRWLWSTGAFLALVALVAWRRWAADRSSRPPRRWVAALTGAVVIVVAVANVPRSVQVEQAGRYLREQRAVAEMSEQVHRSLRGRAIDGPVLIDDTQVAFGTGFTYPLLVDLQEHDIEFRFENPLHGRRFGTARIADGSERVRLRLVTGDPTAALDDAAEVIAHVPGAPSIVVTLERI